MVKKKKVFGHELLLDCYGCKPKTCGDLAHCYSYLDKLVDFIGMHKQEPPTIFRTDRKLYPDKAGLSGWVPLVESSIVIHTLSKENFISIDVYSCGAFDPKKVVAFTKKYFKPKKIETQYIERGKHYYDHKAVKKTSTKKKTTSKKKVSTKKKTTKSKSKKK